MEGTFVVKNILHVEIQYCIIEAENNPSLVVIFYTNSFPNSISAKLRTYTPEPTSNHSVCHFSFSMHLSL